LVGRVAGDIHYDKGKGKDHNVKLIRFSLATNEVFQGSKNKVQFHSLVAFGAKAELCNKWCKKGKLIAIKGKLRNQRWQDEQGNKRKSTQVNIDEITFLGKKEDSAAVPKEEGPTPETEGRKDPF
jgi:single-strand DNA-binding protein